MSTRKGVYCGSFIFGLLLLYVWLAVPVWAQLSTTGTITGTVRDASGATVPQASVTITDQNTGVQTSTISNGDGSFVVPGLPPGTYTVKVSKQGFDTFTESGIVLHPAQVATVNAAMQVGLVSTHVNVTASAVQVQTATPEISSEVSEKQVFTLPLNGRNFQSLSALMPGVTNTSPGTSEVAAGFTQANTMSINGMGTSGTMYYVDGIWNENTGNMTQITITPNPDTIQEVRVLQNNYGVEYSLNGANVVLVQTKSGSDTFHGSAFDYLRNDALNARNFFSPTVSPLKQNIFGYTLGGPVYVPHHYNTNRSKTFFFWSEQWIRSNAGQTLTGATPTAAMREGTFTTLTKDPTTGQPFPQTSPGVYQIPSNLIEPADLQLMNALYPLPNNPAGGFNNYINQIPQVLDDRDDEIKVDHHLGERLLLTGEYFDSRSSINYADNPSVSGPFPTLRLLRDTPLQLAKISLTQTWTPAMVNTSSLSMNNYVTDFHGYGIQDLSQVPTFAAEQKLPFSGGFASNEVPQISFTGGYSQAGTSTNDPQPHAGDLEDSFSDDWSYLRGNHYIQAGVQYVRGTKRQWAFAQDAGLWSFNGQFTGNPIADYLIGDASSLAQASTRDLYFLYYRILSPYVQDRWKVNRRLTFTYGLRIEHYPGIRMPAATGTNFVPADYSPAQAPVVTASGTITPTASYNPVNGLVYNGVNGTPSSFINYPTVHWAPSVGFAWDVFGDGKTALRGGYGITYDSPFTGFCSCYNNPPFTQTITLVTPNFPNSVGAAAAPQGAPSLNIIGPNGGSLPQIQTYSSSVEHRFRNDWFVSIAGAGTVLRHATLAVNLNQPLPDPPYNYNPVINAGTSFTYLYGPYLGYGGITAETMSSNAYWNALEVNVRHPVGHGLLLSAAYTWQHALSENGGNTNLFGDPGVQDSYHPGNDYGNSGINAPQMLAVSAVWNIPGFKDATGLKRLALGGWQYSDITTIQSGFSMNPGLSVAHSGLASRPNLVSNATITGPRTVGEWFNTAAFTAPPAGYFGDAAPGSIPGPGLVNFDMAFYKDFHITERHIIEFRAELFNIFNRANFSAVSTSLGAGNFGQLTAARDPRIAEFALRYQF